MACLEVRLEVGLVEVVGGVAGGRAGVGLEVWLEVGLEEGLKVGLLLLLLGFRLNNWRYIYFDVLLHSIYIILPLCPVWCPTDTFPNDIGC